MQAKATAPANLRARPRNRARPEFGFMERFAIPAFVLDRDGTVLTWNMACARLTGVPASEVVGTKEHWRAFYNEKRPCLADLVLQDRADCVEQFYDVHHRTDAGGGLVTENWCNMPRLGKRLYLATDASPVLDENGQLIAVFETLRDITEHKEAEAEVDYLAKHDALTQLANRAFLMQHLESVTKRSRPYALLMLDIERFKDINETFGHAAGDALLSGFGRLLGAAMPDAFIARVGGDEFALVIEGTSSRGSIAAHADSICAKTIRGVEFEGNTIHARLRIGAAVFPDDAGDAAAIVRHADWALCLAKSQDTDACCFFDAALAERQTMRRATANDLRHAVERKEFVLHYQPLTKLDGEIIGFEALVRWNHPVRGMVSPAEFIPIAEDSGLIGPLGDWVLTTACAEAASWSRPLQIAVNLSPLQFRHGDIVAKVHDTLSSTGLLASRLELEITETAMIENYARALAILGRLKALGVRIAMDDFGTGYSSLAYLQAFPFDKIKLDRSFVARLRRSTQSDAITRAVIGLGHSLSLQILAEGVETRSQLDFLSAESCDFVQGYLFGRPQPIEHYAAQIHMSGHQEAKRAGAIK